MDSPYKTPETDPSDGTQPVKPPNNGKWSNQKVAVVTFLPISMCFICGVLMTLIDTEIFNLFAALIPLTAFICALVTAVKMSSNNGSNFFGLLVLWCAAHAALIFLGFCGCAMIVMS